MGDKLLYNTLFLAKEISEWNVVINDIVQISRFVEGVYYDNKFNCWELVFLERRLVVVSLFLFTEELVQEAVIDAEFLSLIDSGVLLIMSRD